MTLKPKAFDSESRDIVTWVVVYIARNAIITILFVFHVTIFAQSTLITRFMCAVLLLISFDSFSEVLSSNQIFEIFKSETGINNTDVDYFRFRCI